MSVSIPSSNPAYSLESVLQSQIEAFTQPNPAPSDPSTAANSTATATYNNLSAPSPAPPATPSAANTSTTDVSVDAAPQNAPTPPPQVSQAILQGANSDAGHLSGLISQYA